MGVYFNGTFYLYYLWRYLEFLIEQVQENHVCLPVKIPQMFFWETSYTMDFDIDMCSYQSSLSALCENKFIEFTAKLHINISILLRRENAATKTFSVKENRDECHPRIIINEWFLQFSEFQVEIKVIIIW